jgi:hypothetical protein
MRKIQIELVINNVKIYQFGDENNIFIKNLKPKNK